MTKYRLYVGNISHRIRPNEIEQLFGRYGEIVDFDWKDRGQVMTVNFCFVQFRSSRDAVDAMEDLNGHRVLGTPLTVEYARERNSTRPFPPMRGGGGGFGDRGGGGGFGGGPSYHGDRGFDRGGGGRYGPPMRDRRHRGTGLDRDRDSRRRRRSRSRTPRSHSRSYSRSRSRSRGKHRSGRTHRETDSHRSHRREGAGAGGAASGGDRKRSASRSKSRGGSRGKSNERRDKDKVATSVPTTTTTVNGANDSREKRRSGSRSVSREKLDSKHDSLAAADNDNNHNSTDERPKSDLPKRSVSRSRGRESSAGSRGSRGGGHYENGTD